MKDYEITIFINVSEQILNISTIIQNNIKAQFSATKLD